MVVQHNLTAMNSNRMLGLTTSAQAKSTEKLSSGYKINRAADDAAGLAISEKMRRQIRGLTQASANAQDGISAVQTAEGALTEVHDMLQRMNELATKAANGTNSEEERSYIQSEVDALIDEIDRVSETTKFNEIYLLKGGDSTMDTGAAAAPASKKTVTMNDTAKKLAEMQIAIKNTAPGDVYGAGKTDAVTASTPAGTKGTMTLNTTALGANKLFAKTTGGADTTYVEVTDANLSTYFDVDNTGAVTAKTGFDFGTAANSTLAQAGGATSVTATAANNVTGGTEAVPATTGTLDQYVELDANGNLKYKDGAMLYKVDADTQGQYGDQLAAQQVKETELSNYFEAKGTPIRTGANDTDAAVTEETDLSTYFDEYGVYQGGLYLDGTEIGAEQIENYFDIKNADGSADSITAGPALEFNLQVGAEGDTRNKITVKIEAMSAAGIGIDKLAKTGVNTEQNASDAIDVIKAAIKKVSQQRSDLGAVQNRLEHTINNLDNVVENTTSAESQIRDTDMATEMVKYANNNILAQAGQAMLAQANQANQGVLSLLG